MKCFQCNNFATFKIWLHRNLTVDSYFCSNKCCVQYARERGWKYSKKDNVLTKGDEKAYLTERD